MNYSQGTAIASIAYFLLAFFPSCTAAPPSEISRTGAVLGTVCSIKLVGGGSEKLLSAAFARLSQIEDELSVDKPGSQIDEVNAAAGKRAVVVGKDAMAILSRDLELSAWSDGAFDPSVGPLVKLWGIGSAGRNNQNRASPPDPSSISDARKLVGWKNVILDKTNFTVFLQRAGMALDLGSTTKGYAADEVAQLVRAAGVRKALIDLGGNVLVIGSRPDDRPWRIGLQDPFSDDRGAYFGIASLIDKTMVTSGVYERYFLDKSSGKRYHHIIDTKTGYPVENGLMSVTVVTKKSFDADGFTTTVFALGRERGMALAREKGIDVIIVDKGKKVYMSPGVSTYFSITDKSFSFAE